MTESNIENMTNKIIIEFSKTIEMFGLTTLEARLFVYLYLEEKPMTLDEMSEAIGKSKTSMSTSVRSLSELNLVTRVWKKGVRKDLYEANGQLFKTFMNFYINKWIDATNHQKDSLEEIKKRFKEDQVQEHPDDDTTTMNDRLAFIIDFHKQVEKTFRGIRQD